MKTLFVTLLFTAAVAAQPLTFSNETAISQARIGWASFSQYQVQTASDGTNQLIVWTEDRGLIGTRTQSVLRIYATRVDPQGHVLDIPNILADVGTVRRYLKAPGAIGVFWNGHEYVVVGPGKYARISAAGELLDPAPRTFTFTSHGIAELAWSGDRLLIVSAADTRPTAFYFSLYDASFNIVKGDTFLRNQSATPSEEPRLATNGKSFVMVTTDCQPACRTIADAIDDNGNVLHSGAVADAGSARPLVATDGRNYLILSSVYTTNDRYDFNGVLLDSLGGLIGNMPPLVRDNFASSATADLAWEGDGYQLVYRDLRYTSPAKDTLTNDLVALPLSGTAVAGTPTMIDSYGNQLALVAAGRPGARFALAGSNVMWSTYVPGSTWKGYAYSNNTTASFVLGQGVLQQENPAAATIGNVSLLAWREPVSDAKETYGVFAGRVDDRGHALDPAALPLGSSSCDSTFPQVTTSGRDFLVVWQEPNGIRAARVSPDGHLLDSTPIAISNNVLPGCDGVQPAVAWNGSSWLVAWIGPSGFSSGLNVVRVSPDGTILDPIPIDLGRGAYFSQLHAASDGTNFFLSWTVTNNGFTEAHGTRITGEGTLLDGSGFSLGLRQSSALFWNGRSYVLLSSQPDGLHAVRVTPSGQLLDFIAGQPGPAMKVPFDAATHNATCGAHGCFIYAISNGALVATRLDETATGISPTTTTLANPPADWKQVIPFGADLGQVAYLRLATEAPYAGVYHLFTRQLLPARGRAARP